MRRPKARKKKPTYCGRTRTAKIRYRTLEDAKSARIAVSNRVEYVRIYRCPECKGYHLTTKEQFEFGNPHTAWKMPDRAVSSREEPDDPEENQDDGV
jgi:hypothetical protein